MSPDGQGWHLRSILSVRVEDEKFRYGFNWERLPGLRERPPIKLKASATPPDHGLRANDDESLLPSGPEPSGNYPEEFVAHSEARHGSSSPENHQLLAESQVFKKEFAAIADDAKQGAN
jgi:hypothetical protein